ncbi:MAG: response regulator [Archangium sp.]|nr:response regulator [Archangium sp.]
MLIIDDVENVGLSLQRLLTKEHDAEYTTRSRQALEATRRGERWDVVLCDLMMPELNGMEFVAEVERIAPALMPRIVIMTGGAFTPGAREFLARWPHHTLEKPCDPELLSRVIAQVLELAPEP